MICGAATADATANGKRKAYSTPMIHHTKYRAAISTLHATGNRGAGVLGCMAFLSPITGSFALVSGLGVRGSEADAKPMSSSVAPDYHSTIRESAICCLWSFLRILAVFQRLL